MSSGSLYSVPEGESIAQQNSGRAPSDHPLLSDLRVLKSMLTEELITQTEYDAKKTDILDRVGVYSTERADWTDAEISERIEQSTKKEWRLNAVSSKKKARRSGSKMNIRGHHNTIDPGLKLLGKRLNYFMLPSRVKTAPLRRRTIVEKAICPCFSKRYHHFNVGGHHQETFAQKLAEGMLKGKTKKQVKHAPPTPLMYRLISLLKYTPKPWLFGGAFATLVLASLLFSTMYFFGNCSTIDYSFGVIFLQSLTQLLGANPEGIDVTQTQCSFIFSVASAMGVGLKSLAFAFCVAILQDAAPSILFSRIATVRLRDGFPLLMVRVDAPGSRCLLDVQASGEWFYTAVTSENEKYYKYEPLKFQCQSTLQMATTLCHKIDRTSPLFGQPLDELQGIISVQLRAVDVLTRKETRAVTMYMCDTDIRINHRFKDVVKTSGFVAVAENRATESDLFSFHDTDPIKERK